MEGSKCHAILAWGEAGRQEKALVRTHVGEETFKPGIRVRGNLLD